MPVPGEREIKKRETEREHFVAFNMSFLGLVCLTRAAVTQCCVLSVPTPSRIPCLRGGRFPPPACGSGLALMLLGVVLRAPLCQREFYPRTARVSCSAPYTLWKFACSDVAVPSDRLSILDFSLYLQSGRQAAGRTELLFLLKQLLDSGWVLKISVLGFLVYKCVFDSHKHLFSLFFFFWMDPRNHKNHLHFRRTLFSHWRIKLYFS